MRKRSSFESVSLAELMARGLVEGIEGNLVTAVPSGGAILSAAPQPTALVVDDEAAIADTLAAILGLNGFSAQSAYSAEAALKMLPADRNSLDFVFLTKPLHPEDLLKKLAEWGFSRPITTP